ncbi:MAG: 5'-methylthioadenosine/S-adenosylhomocysteine nucleosidase [Tissierellia bacterium]|nr:5'-methylthioadenosine/S-adenosylhomocysteine nucleosidase [Tissierellia bacterium]
MKSQINTILVVAAMGEELRLFKDSLKNIEFKGNTLEGTLEGKRVELLKTGVGQINAEKTLRDYMDSTMPKVVIHVGIAGALDEKLPILDAVIGPVTDGKSSYFPDKSLVEEIKVIAMHSGISLHYGKMLSLDLFLQNAQERDSLRLQSKALTIDMESFSIGKVCHEKGIPFIVIRSISDKSTKDSYEIVGQNISKAAEISCELGCKLACKLV